MAAFLNVCCFLPTAGGLADWTYSSPVLGYQSPVAAGAVTGTKYKYRAESADLAQWEVGEGTFNSASGVLTRTKVLSNSSGSGLATGQTGAGTKINFSAAPRVAIVALSDDLLSGDAFKPFFILSTGQSQLVRSPAFAWAPNPNARVWNNVLEDDTSVGNAFVPLPSTTVNFAHKLASDIADAYPGRPVYLLNVAFSGRPIAKWMVGGTNPNAYGNIQANIPGAMAAAGVTKADLLAWWQIEGDSNPLSTTYIADHAAVMNRFFAETWFPQETPVLLHGMCPLASGHGVNPNADLANVIVAAVALQDPDKRRYVHVGALAGDVYWTNDPLFYGHMTGQGYFSAGAMAASAFLHGTGRNVLQGVNVDPQSGKIAIGTPGTSPTANLTVNHHASFQPPAALAGTLEHHVGPDASNGFSLWDTFGGFFNLIGRRTNGTKAAPTAVVNNDNLAGIGAQGYDGTANVTANKASILLRAIENWTTTARGTAIAMFTTRKGTDTAVEALHAEADFIKIMPGTAPPAFGDNTKGILMTSTANFGIFVGTGAPNFTAGKGSLYLNTTGASSSTRIYTNTDGATGWTSVTTAT